MEKKTVFEVYLMPGDTACPFGLVSRLGILSKERKEMKIYKNPLKIFCTMLLFMSLFLPIQPSEIYAQQQTIKEIKGGDMTINFDKSIKLPPGFRAETTGYSTHAALWQVVQDKQAPSRPNILKITEIKSPSGSQFNICWSDKIRFKDGEIEVKVRADSGRIDQGGGPVWRVKDRLNYYVARLNPLEDNFRIYYVKNGRRTMIGSASVRGIKEGMWFTIKIAVKGDMITGWVNGKRLIQVEDSTLGDEGGVGLWSKADAASSFDDLTVRAEE